jgi:hypothetical protein
MKKIGGGDPAPKLIQIARCSGIAKPAVYGLQRGVFPIPSWAIANMRKEDIGLLQKHLPQPQSCRRPMGSRRAHFFIHYKICSILLPETNGEHLPRSISLGIPRTAWT